MKGLFVLLVVCFVLGGLVILFTILSLKGAKKRNVVGSIRNALVLSLMLTIGVTVGLATTTKYGDYVYRCLSGEAVEKLFKEGNISLNDFQNSQRGICQVKLATSTSNEWFYTYTKTEVVYL